ncbi:MAG: ComEC/Rec2 family competence protein, partial [Bacteroidales bacterium]|nr:ComEC/Rec2 family competence protein [Bacteroidales bacterium]
LAIGDRSALTRDLRAAYRESGAMHLLALSGLHVGLIYALLRQLLAPLGGHQAARLLRSTVILSLLWAYALITGLSASISRAVLMISFYEISGHLSGDRDALSALFGSALILLLANPEVPRDIGFQLSYTAVLSILLLHPWLKDRLQTRSRLLKRTWELLSVSLCCQATCGVLAWLYFGTFPRFFLLTTLLAIPLTTAVMYAIAATVATSALSSLLPALTTLSGAASKLLAWLLHLLNTVIRLISEL